MPYTPTTWVNGATVTPALLNNIETGVVTVAGQFVNVKDPTYGATGNGVTDDTAAFVAAAATGKAVFVPPGTYVGSFNLNPAGSPQFFGISNDDTTITPSAGNYFIDGNQSWSTLLISGITFSGGAGAIRNRYTGSNVTYLHQVLDCRFLNYTSAAISHNASDMPLWKIHRCTFNAANNTTSIGIALPGLSDLNTIENCEFQKNRVHIKLASSGNNAKIQNCDFVQYGAMTASNPRTFVWVVPQTSATNAGNGLVITGSKFGNENLDAADLRILYADQGSGTYFGDKLPDTTVDSAGFIVQHTLRDVFVNGSGSFNNPLIYACMSPDKLRGCSIVDIKLAGGTPDYLLKFRTITTTPSPEGPSNLIADVMRADNNFVPFEASNQIGAALVESDPQGVLRSPTQALQILGGGRSTGYTRLLQQRINGFTLTTATRAAIADSIGGTDAAEITFPGTAFSYVPASSVSTDRPVWIEFELQQGSSSALSALTVLFALDTASSGGASNYMRRTFVPDASWRVYRIKTYAPVSSNSILLKFLPASGSTGTKVKIGRVRMYHAYEPQSADLDLNAQQAFQRRSGAIAEAFPRWVAKMENLSAALTSGQQLFAPLVLQAGQVISQIGFWSGTTALSGGSNQWFGLWDVSRNKLAVTNDDTTTAWGANAEKLLTIATPYVVSSDGLYYASIMINATTVPTLLGISTQGNITGAVPVLTARDTTNTGLTNPASAPATATFALAGSLPWAYVK